MAGPLNKRMCIPYMCMNIIHILRSMITYDSDVHIMHQGYDLHFFYTSSIHSVVCISLCCVFLDD